MSDEEIPRTSMGFAARGSTGVYARALVAHRWIVLLVAFATLAGAAVYLAIRTPSYEANVDVLFTPLQQGDRSSQGLPLVVASSDPTRDVQTAGALLDSPQAASLAARRLGHGWTRGRVASATTVEPSGQSNILVVTSRADSAVEAARVASTYAAATLEARRVVLRERALAISPTVPTQPTAGDSTDQQLRADINLLLAGSDPNFSIVHTVATSGSSSAPSAKVILALALVGGIALGAVAALLLELLSNRIRDTDELQELFPVPVRAHVPQTPPRGRAGAPPSAGSTAAIQILAGYLDAGPEPRRVVMATSGSRGDGTTWTALELARSLAAQGHHVLLVDSDLRHGSASRALALDGQIGVSEVLADNATVADAVTHSPRFPELLALPAGRSQVRAFGTGLATLLDELRTFAEFIVIDSPPLPEATDLLPALRNVDEVLIVARPGRTRRASFRVLRELLETSATRAFSMVVVGERGRPPLTTVQGRVSPDADPSSITGSTVRRAATRRQRQ